MTAKTNRITLTVVTSINTTLGNIDVAENRLHMASYSSEVASARANLRAAAEEWRKAMLSIMPDTSDTEVCLKLDI